jgi:hypothetical protein
MSTTRRRGPITHKLGVQKIRAAYEAQEESGVVSLMIISHCLRFSFNLCPKQAKGVQGVYSQVKAEPMTHFPPTILRAGSITCAARIPAWGTFVGKRLVTRSCTASHAS